MTRPVLIGIGSHVIAALVEQLGAVPGLAEVVELHLSPEMPGGRPRAAAEVLGRAVVVLEESGAMDAAERAALGPECTVIVLPRLEFASLWPQMAEAAPFGDRIAQGVVRAVADPAVRRAAYDAVPLDKLVDLDRLHGLEAREMFRREAGCDIRVAGFVLSRFRTERLFHSAVHPAGVLLEQVMAQLLGHPAIAALVAGSFDGMLRAVVPELAAVFADEQAPVLPGVAAHFGLAWWSPGLEYRQGAEARDGAGWVEWHLRAPAAEAAAEALAGPEQPTVVQPTVLQPAGQVVRVVPFFATAIDPGLARHGAALLSADSARYAAAPVLLTVRDEVVVSSGGGVAADAMPAVRVEGPAFLGFGPGWADDPHGMVGVVPRLMVFARLRRRDAGLLVLLPEALAATPLVRETLALLGIGEASVVGLADGAVTCARLVRAGPFDMQAVSPFGHAAAQALARLVPLGPAGPRLVYLRTAAAAGRIANEAEVADALVRRGFTVVDVERTSLAERIAVLRGAGGLVAAQGPALAELMFCPPGAAVLELVGPVNPRTLFWSLASCAGLRYGYVVGEAVGTPRWDGDYAVPVAMLDHAAGVMAHGA